MYCEEEIFFHFSHMHTLHSPFADSVSIFFSLFFGSSMLFVRSHFYDYYRRFSFISLWHGSWDLLCCLASQDTRIIATLLCAHFSNWSRREKEMQFHLQFLQARAHEKKLWWKNLRARASKASNNNSLRNASELDINLFARLLSRERYKYAPRSVEARIGQFNSVQQHGLLAAEKLLLDVQLHRLRIYISTQRHTLSCNWFEKSTIKKWKTSKFLK